MFARCRAPAWGPDDFSHCFERDYLQTLFPLIVCGLSIIHLAFQTYQKAKASKYYHAYSSLNDPRHVWSIRTPHYDAEDTDSDTEDELDRNQRLALRPSVSRQTVSTMAVTKPRGEVTVVVLEEATVLAALALHVAVLFTGANGHKGRIASIASIAVWAYIATLASLRLLLSSTSKFSFPRLWYHTAFIYGFQWLFSVLLFRSALLHPRSKLHQRFAIVDFALVTLLFLIALTSRKGNRPVELEYEGDIKPAREPIASVLSLATFTWVDPIVWQGYKKTYELVDVWNLAPKDKAGAVIENYRQVKKTSALAYHLLKHFKRGLLIQGGWAVISGFLTFAPTLLLKAILEYIEEPEYTPRNAAWFYVILLFVSGSASALADGQALWIGRKICIRLRAVVIGEIYAKALKRRVASGADKVLGEGDKKTSDKKEEEQPKGIKRIMTFGRKKKKNNEEPGKSTEDNSETPESDAQVTTGAIINLMAVDAFKVSEISAYLHFLWANTPVQVVMAIGLLYGILGYSSIAGIGMMIILLPINLYVAKQFSAIQKKILAATDARIHSTNEVLSNIRIIKYFAWEQRFIGVVNDKRYQELTHLRRRYILWAVAATIWSGSPILITFLSFFVYTKVENRDLIPSVAFTALSLFQILRIPLDQLADMIAHVQESKVSVDRIEEYLSEPETDKYSQLVGDKLDDNGDSVIGFEGGTFSWGGKDLKDKAASEAFKLMDLDFNFKVGELNVVVGPTGSGKTSLLMALLGEMTKLKGSVYLPGAVSREDLKADPATGLTESVAYCAQQAWLVNGTIKDNIVFASNWNAKRYKDVIEACSLQRDLDILDGGDQTIVGEKGVTLSGGQKQRISLARAMYSKARHVLLDDVLSAVDSHTAKWIFDRALMGPLMRNRTCILVTHNVSLCLPQSEYAIVLDNGRITAQGTAKEVISSGKLTEDLTKSRPASRGASRVPSLNPLNADGEEAAEDHHANGNANGDAHVSTDAKAAPNAYEETKAEGGVKLSIIIMYLKAMGPWYYWIGAALAFVAQQISSVSTNVWIRTWANSYADRRVGMMSAHSQTPVTHVPAFSGLGTCMNSGTCSWNFPFLSQPEKTPYSYNLMQTSFTTETNEVNSNYFLGVYAILGIIFMFITFLREGFLFGGSLAASRRVHERLIQAVTHAKFRFFDQTPLGQLMNRFSKDIESVDQEVAPVAIGVVHCLASIITIVILISIITPGFLIAGFFITILYAAIGRFYLSSSRDLKRLESVHRSPLYQQFGETLSGMTTIRAYGDERRFIRENLTKINTQHRPFIYLWAANRWLAFRVDVVGALVSFFAGVFVVRSVGKIDAGAAGLALTYAVTFTENVLWFVRLYSANEQNMNSVERIKEYLDVDQEAAPVVPENRPPSNWPSQGSVEFINYSTRYRPDFDKVLKNVTFKILPGEKVGVVGRTGAGKSSLALALFRALEAEEGKVLIDDIDIGLIGLQDLRENIVMVPQDPTLFTGTIRSNLDPFGLFTDEEIFQALREVHLISSSTSNATSIAGSPVRPGTPQQAIEIPRSPSVPVVADVGASFNVGSTTHPSSILANPEWHLGDPGNDAVLHIPSGSNVNVDQSTSGIVQGDNKNPFRNLNSPVSESGSNLSQGQRQLLCLARALLKAPKVLLMDEATASIDYATDAKIQETIREIKNTTITIAHRLQTIIDYDKVLVLDKGAVVEFGDPWDLLQKKEKGSFWGMCETSGELEGLEKLAKEAWVGRGGVEN